ncbi:MAG: nucleoside deaminase [Nanoarchaeota archaeon]|nr:nucleoside deaminase [Nanoarchaeota archaeon]
MDYHELFMREALTEAERSLEDGGYGIGAVLVLDRDIISRARGSATYLTKDPTEHAETQLIDMIKGTELYTPDHLRKMTVYTTVEACIMCYSTLLILKLGTIVYGARDDQGGFTPAPDIIPPIFRATMPKVIGGVLEKECLNVFLKNREEMDRKYLNGKLFF